MAKTKKSSRASKAKKSSKSDKLSPAVRREVFALVLIACAILLVVGFFDAGGALTEWLLKGFRLIIGLATYALPPLMLFLAFRLFVGRKDEDEEVSPPGFANYLGFALFIVAVAGLFHIGIEPTQALERARLGEGGGLVGYLLNSILLTLLNVFTSSVVLVTAA